MGKSEVEMDIKEETMDLCRITEILECKLKSCLESDFESVGSEEAGAITDMIKDMYQSKKYAVEACYYKKLLEKMEEGDEAPSRMYFPVGDVSAYADRIRPMSGDRSAGRWDDGDGRERVYPSGDRTRRGVQGRDTSGSSRQGAEGTRGRYGFSFDEYMEAREMYPGQEQEHKRMRMEALNRELDELVDMGKEVVRDMSPEEKQAWKGKISKILNM